MSVCNFGLGAVRINSKGELVQILVGHSPILFYFMVFASRGSGIKKLSNWRVFVE